MGKNNFLLAQKCVNARRVDPNLITVADTVSAFEAVIKSEPPPRYSNTTSRLRTSSRVLCQYVGEQKEPRETKTPENTLVNEIIGIEEGLKKCLKGKISKEASAQHLVHVHLIIECGRAMGVSHAIFDAQQEWDQLRFVRMDSKAKRLKRALRRTGIRPRDVSMKHINIWSAACKDRGLTGEGIRQSISQFKLAVRASKLQSSFPNLHVARIQPEQYCVEPEEMYPHTREQLTEMMQLLERLDANGVIWKCADTRANFSLTVRQLYGYAQDHAKELEIENGEITDLDQIFNQKVISACARWGSDDKGWTKDTVSIFLHRFHSVFKILSPYSSQDWEWMLDLITEFLPEPESEKEDRLAERAFNYDYDSLETIPEQIRDKRLAAENLGDREREWMILCEFLMLFLVTDPWPLQCLARCTVYCESANLFKKDGQWRFRFGALEVPFRRTAKGPFPQRLVPLLELYLKYRGESPGPLFRTRKGLAFSSDRLSALVKDLTEIYVDARVPGSAFRDIFAYWWLLKRPGPEGYASLARILWVSDHACRLRYDKAYRDGHRAQPHRKRRRRKNAQRTEMSSVDRLRQTHAS